MKITDYTENNEKSINQLYALYAGFRDSVFLFFINEFARQLDSHTAMFYTATYIPVNPQLWQPDHSLKWGHYQQKGVDASDIAQAKRRLKYRILDSSATIATNN